MLDKAEIITLVLEKIRKLEKKGERLSEIKIKVGNGQELVIDLEERKQRSFRIIKDGDDD